MTSILRIHEPMPMETPPASYHLPVELWRHIIENLILDPLELGQGRPSENHRVNRSALHHLCLTSHWFAAITRPYLYETVVISVHGRNPARKHEHRVGGGSGANSLVCLLRTLAQSPTLRPLIKNIALPITLTAGQPGSFPDYLDVAHAWQEHVGDFVKLPADEQQVFGVVGLSLEAQDAAILEVPRQTRVSRADAEASAQKVVAALLSMLPGAATLLLQDLFSDSSGILDQAVETLIAHPRFGPSFMPNLTCLQIQLAPSVMATGLDDELRVPLDAELSSPLLNQPRLRRLDLWHGWFTEVHVSDQVSKGIGRLEDMRLTVAANPNRLYPLVAEAKRLRNLYLGLLSATARILESSEGGDLNDVLLSRRDTLESLSIETRHVTTEEAKEHMGPLERLICLPDLTRLSHLSLEPYLLLDWLTINQWPRILNTLPPNIVSLTFFFVPENGADLSRIWGRSGIGVALRASREKWQTKAPRLRHIRLQPLPYSARAVEMLKGDLHEAGIALSWQNAPGDELSLKLGGLNLS